MRNKSYNRKRRPLKKGRSKKLFTRTAQKTHPKNVSSGPMRGGIRL